jgi:basic amino acid/polyamine antiporter, APA family
VQVVVIYTLADPATTAKPAVDSARQFLGPIGVSLVAAGTLISVYGYFSANMLHTPRVAFAMAERGDFPSLFGAIHSRFRAPYVSIVVFALLFLFFSIVGDFRWNASFSPISRLFMYAAVVATLPAMRRSFPQGGKFHLRAGILFTVLGLAFTGVLLLQMHRAELIVMSTTIALALLNWVGRGAVRLESHGNRDIIQSCARSKYNSC